MFVRYGSLPLPGRFGTHPLHRIGLLIGIPLLFPRIGAHVVAVDFPESRRVDVQELQRADPLRALPEIQLRNDEPARSAVVGLEVLAIVLRRQENVLALQVFERDVRRVTLLGARDGRRRFRPDRARSKTSRSATPSQRFSSRLQRVTQ